MNDAAPPAGAEAGHEPPEAPRAESPAEPPEQETVQHAVARATHWMMVFTACLVGVGLLQVGVGVFQGWFTKGQLQLNRQARRPWVGIHVSETKTTSAQAPLFIIPFKNSGGSPALKTNIRHKAVAFADPPDYRTQWTRNNVPPFPTCFEEAARLGEGLPVMPGAMFNDVSDPLSTEDFAAVQRWDRTMFDVGCIVYRDDAGNERRGEFCLYYPHPPKGGLLFPPGAPPKEPPRKGAVLKSMTIEVMLSFCPFGNTAE